MLDVRADLAISCRWILPMTSPDEVLENHTLWVRDGRIVDVLPTQGARPRYAASVHLERRNHLLMPGMVNAHARIRGADPGGTPEPFRERALAGIAELLAAGTTCIGCVGFNPADVARIAAEQGLRAVIGLPVADTASRWAHDSATYLTRALNLRDEYRGHPLIATTFAPQSPATLHDATLRRIAILADELDAGLMMPLHADAEQVTACVAVHGVRPIERIQSLGLLTPALTALDVAHVNEADLALAQRAGLSVVLCPQATLAGGGLPPVAAWAATGLRLGLGTGSYATAGLDLWTDMRLYALASHAAGTADRAWEALAAATRGGAAALALDAEIGTLQPGKWADLCCVDARVPGLSTDEPWPTRLVFHGGRHLVSDVWIAGRHLCNGGDFTRLDWPGVAAHLDDRRGHVITGESR